jgi:tetratricopeptide (TPR) repeat protein
LGSYRIPGLGFVKKMSFCPRVTLTLLLISTGFVYGQTVSSSRPGSPPTDPPGSIRGHVVLPNGSPLAEAVRVNLRVLRGDQAITYTDQQGQFELNNLSAGQYTVEIDADRDGRFEFTSERVLVRRGGGPTLITIYLKEKRSEQTRASGRTISIAMLDQKVPSAARREFDKASRLSAEGNARESIEALRRAIGIYPEFLLAHNDLGAQLLEQGQFEEAAVELRAAIKIDPKAFNPQLNLGIVLVRQKNFQEAREVLEKALSLEPASPAAHLYAGIAAVALNQGERGESEFKAAHDLGGIPYAVALLDLGRLYLKRGERELALKSFESYLRESPDAADAAQVEKLIGMLR